MMTNDNLTDVRTTPLARRVAAERGIDLNMARGSGFAGRIFARDLDDVMTEGAAALAPVIHEEPIYEKPGIIAYVDPEPASEEAPVLRFAREEEPPKEAPSTDGMIAAAISADRDVAGIMRMNDVRRSVADSTAISAAQTAAVTQLMETDITELSNILERVNATREKPQQLSITALYLKALAVCVREKERFRMRLSDAGDAYLLMEGANIGLQFVAGDNVMTPVIRDVDQKPLDEIATTVVALRDKAKRGGFREDERRGAAITLTDKGDSGIYAFTPIINLPESAMLGIGAPYQRLIMTGKGIENRQFVMQSLTFDHRVINGHEADEFQLRLKTILEEPGPLFD